MTVNPAGSSVRTTPLPRSSDDQGEARSVTYPRVDEDTLARRIYDTEFERVPGNGKHFAKWSLLGAGVIGAIATGVGLLVTKGKPNALQMRLTTGAVGALVGAGVGALVASATNNMTPGKAREYAKQSLDFEAESRPPLPPASRVPTERIEMPGVVLNGLSGSTVGGIVQLQQSVIGDITLRATTTRNSAGEPTIVIGMPSGETITTEQVIRRTNATINSIGLGRVLYDPAGYGSMAEAIEAFDGKHAAAIVKDGERYKLVDVDAESWDALGDRSYAMTIADERVKAIFANQGVYFPSSMESVDDGPRLFMFAQEQDIDRTLPQSLRELSGQPIGSYETNAVPARNQFEETYRLVLDGFHDGDQYSGPGWTDRSEAIQHMVNTQGRQALVKAGDRYYVADTVRTDGSGESTDLSAATSETPQGAAVLGLRTTGVAERVELVEDEGGLYAPVDDWWVRVNIEE